MFQLTVKILINSHVLLKTRLELDEISLSTAPQIGYQMPTKEKGRKLDTFNIKIISYPSFRAAAYSSSANRYCPFRKTVLS